MEYALFLFYSSDLLLSYNNMDATISFAAGAVEVRVEIYFAEFWAMVQTVLDIEMRKMKC